MRRIVAIISLLVIILTAGATLVAAQITTPGVPGLPEAPGSGAELPEVTVPAGPEVPDTALPQVPGVDISDDGITVGDVRVSTEDDGSTVVTAGDTSVSTGPLDDTGDTVPVPASITAGDVIVSTEVVDGQTVISFSVPLDDRVLSCQLELAEDVTLEEFIAALEAGFLSPSATPVIDPEDPLGSLLLETEFGTLSCSSE